MLKIFAHGWLLLLIVFLLAVYAFQSYKFLLSNSSLWTKRICFGIYWFLVLLQSLAIFFVPKAGEHLRGYVFTYIVAILLFELAGTIFSLLDDLRRGFLFLLQYFSSQESTEGKKIKRSTFLSWVGMLLGSTLLGSIAYGLTNKYNYKIRRVKISSSKIPNAFKRLKIIQISDIHSGSFDNKTAVEKGIKMILEEKPDLILFTGDLVNNRATEMQPYMDIFSQLKAPMGVYSTLGNHDYGDYVDWPSAKEKQQNLEDLKQVHAALGWKLLMNEHIIFDRNGEKIALLGIENWGAKGHFPKYGKLNLAYAGTEEIAFKILMSHDPSHWDAEVIPKYNDIDLTLSGHTHGMQYGIEIPGIKWSPIQWMYKEWAGLYSSGEQQLYVNRGFGFLGYPGRFGILPEITVLELD